MAGKDFLQDLGLFEGLRAAQLDRIAAVAVERRYHLRNTGLVLRGELWTSTRQAPRVDSGFGFDHLTEAA